MMQGAKSKGTAIPGVVRAHVPGSPFQPGQPPWPGQPRRPLTPSWPQVTPPAQDPVSPVRVWQDPHADWKGRLYERLLEKRIVLAAGILDDDAATRLSAQLLTLDAEQDQPIRLELQNLRAELPAALTVMGILDVLHAPVHACASGEIAGPALGVLASCPAPVWIPQRILHPDGAEGQLRRHRNRDQRP